MKPRNNTNNNKKIAIGAAAVVALIAAVLVGGPIMSAGTWKSASLEKTNTRITQINASNRDISLYVNKLEPSADDMQKLVAAYDTQIKQLKDAVAELKEVGGIGVVDVTGVYKKATDTRAELIASYNEMINLNSGEKARTSAQLDVMKIMAKNSDDDSIESARASVANLKKSAETINTFAASKDGTPLDKKFGAALGNMATSLDAMLNAAEKSDQAGYNKAMADVEKYGKEIDSLAEQGTQETKEFQKKIDANIERLNKAAKNLE